MTRYTPSRYRDWAEHIVENIDRIFGYAGDPPDAAKLELPLVADAVERCLERISEAACRFDRAGCDLDLLAPNIGWRDVRGFGNVSRHEYDNIDARFVTATVLFGLKDLREAAERLRLQFAAEAARSDPS